MMKHTPNAGHELYRAALLADTHLSLMIRFMCPGKTRWTLTAEERMIPAISDAMHAKYAADDAWLSFMRTGA
jgi:hypothetical protein